MNSMHPYVIGDIECAVQTSVTLMGFEVRFLASEVNEK